MNNTTKFKELVMPLLPWRYQVKLSYDTENIFSKQVVKCTFDFHNNTLELTTRQPRDDGGFCDLVRRLNSEYHNIQVEFLNELAQVTHTENLQGKMIAHKFELNYSVAENTPAEHHITLQLL